LRHLGKNIAALFVLQVSVYAVPLITTPYLARTLGVANFGLLGVASAMVSYISLISDWGFAFTATRETARHAADPGALRKILWDTLLAKALLCGAALTVFLAVILLIPLPQWRGMVPLLLVYSLTPVTGIFGVGWFLQGMEKMVGYAAVSLIGRLAYVPLVFAFVHTQEDVLIVAVIQSGTSIVSVVASLVVASRKVPLMPIQLDVRAAWRQIREGFPVFLSTGGISLYTQSNIILVGTIAGPIQAGLYSGGEKIQRALQGLAGPVSAAVYPRINNLLVSNPNESHKLMRWTLIGQGGFTLCLSIAMFLSADIVTTVFLGNQYVNAIPVIRWLSAVPFLTGLSNALGVNMMFPFGMNEEMARITVASGVFNLATLSLLTYEKGAVGAAISIVMTEIFVTSAMAWTIYAKRKTVFQYDKN
jgi:O-antigen/teichoic acid export membrane protein